MHTILPLGALLALSLASCSSSANSFTGPDDVQPAIDPAGPGVKPDPEQPSTPCEAPGGRPAATASPLGSGTFSESSVPEPLPCSP
jgi:hypothetical protein